MWTLVQLDASSDPWPSLSDSAARTARGEVRRATQCIWWCETMAVVQVLIDAGGSDLQGAAPNPNPNSVLTTTNY